MQGTLTVRIASLQIIRAVAIQRRDCCVWMDPADSRKCQVSEKSFDRQIRIKGSDGTWRVLQVRGPGIGKGRARGTLMLGGGNTRDGEYCLDSNRRQIRKHKKNYGEKGPESGA